MCQSRAERRQGVKQPEASRFVGSERNRLISIRNGLMQKRNKEYERAKKTADGTYMGPTPLSDFVCDEAHGTDDRITAILHGDGDHRLDRIFSFLPEPLHPSARELILSSVLLVRAAWDHKVLSVVSAFPLLLLKMLKEPCEVESQTRAAIAGRLFSHEGDCCLACPHSDFTIKCKQF